MSAPKIYTVAELSRGIKYLLEDAFREVWVEGEISGLKVSSLGHVYFDLKDASSNIAGVMFRGSAASLKFEPENGLLVRVRGSITTYDKQSKYQLLAREMQPAGIGPLQLAFEQLKKKLAAEGLFDPSRKRPIPALPQRIGVVTSPTGAAIRDILAVLKRRYANLHIIIAPVKVQGEGSKEEIAAAIKDLNALSAAAGGEGTIDVLLVGRGGGSMEDLWAFNEELVARAIAGSAIPVISCVGHETDTTIADFAADLRAPTPSAAAEIVVRSKAELVANIAGLERRLLQSLRIYYENLSGRFRRLAASRMLLNPMALLERPTRHLDDAVEALMRAGDDRLRRARERVNLNSEKLKALSPLFPLRKGYAVVTDARGKAVRSASGLKPGDRLNLRFAEGKADAEVLGGGGGSAPAADRPRAVKKKDGGAEQEDLW